MDQQIIWSPGITLADIEKQVILKAFRFFRGNKTTTANALGISIRTLDTRLDEYEKWDKEREFINATQRTEREKFLARQRGNPTANEYGASVLHSTPVAVANAVESRTGSLGTTPGVHVEPVVTPRPQQTVPMHERKEVQSVSPRPVAPSHPKKSR